MKSGGFKKKTKRSTTKTKRKTPTKRRITAKVKRRTTIRKPMVKRRSSIRRVEDVVLKELVLV